MIIVILILIFCRPLISSLAFPYANLIHTYLLVSALVIHALRRGVPLERIKQVKYPILLFILSLVISVLRSGDKMFSISESSKFIIGIFLFLSVINFSKEEKDKTLICIVASGILISLLAIEQYLFGFRQLLTYMADKEISDPFALDYITRGRAFSPFVTPNTLGGYLAMIIGASLIYKRKTLLFIPLSIALLFSKSLGAFLSLFLALVLYFYLAKKLDKKGILTLGGILTAIIGIFIARSLAQKEHIQPLFSTVMRLDYWKDALKIIKMHPFVGVGVGNFNLVLSRYAHNSYLQIWAEMGILGLISFLWLVAAVFKAGLRDLKNSPDKNRIIGLSCAASAFLLHNLIDFSFFLPEVAFIWWVIIGLLF